MGKKTKISVRTNFEEEGERDIHEQVDISFAPS